MKNKAFTLIEVTITVLILALITLLVVPKIKNVINDKKEIAYENIINSIELAAKSYVYLNSNNIDAVLEEKEYTLVSLSNLIENGLLQNNLKNPITNQEISVYGKVKIEKVNDKYIFTYIGVEGGYSNSIFLTVNLEGGNIDNNPTNTYDSGSIVELSIPTKTGYTFSNWIIVNGDSILNNNNTITIGNTDTEIKANWKINSTLIVDLDGGQISNNPEGAYAQSTTFTVENPTKTGHIFSNWSIEYGNGTISGNNVTMGSQNMKIKAIYIPIEYDIVYNCNGGLGSTSTSNHTYGEEKALSINSCYYYNNMPYSFKGWGTTSSATTAEYTDGQHVLNLRSVQDHTLTLYAIWTPLLSITGNYEFVDEGNGNWKVKVFGSVGNTSGTASLTANAAVPIDIFLVGGGNSGGGGSRTGENAIGMSGGAGGKRITYTNKTLISGDIVIGGSGTPSTAFGFSSASGSSSGGGSGAGSGSCYGCMHYAASAGASGGYAFDSPSESRYGGGGGGGAAAGTYWGTIGSAAGGAGGGGRGGDIGANNAGNGVANTGGGGGGGACAGNCNPNGTGGSGIVIFRNAR